MAKNNRPNLPRHSFHLKFLVNGLLAVTFDTAAPRENRGLLGHPAHHRCLSADSVHNFFTILLHDYFQFRPANRAGRIEAEKKRPIEERKQHRSPAANKTAASKKENPRWYELVS
jgi:hypothetical protein